MLYAAIKSMEIVSYSVIKQKLQQNSLYDSILSPQCPHKIIPQKLYIVVYTYNPNTWEAKAENSGILSYSGLYSEINFPLV